MVRNKIGDKPLTVNEKKARERKLKRDFGLIDKTYWLMPEHIDLVNNLQEKALKEYKKNKGK